MKWSGMDKIAAKGRIEITPSIAGYLEKKRMRPVGERAI